MKRAQPEAPVRIALTPGEPAGIGPGITLDLCREPFPGAVVTVVADATLFLGPDITGAGPFRPDTEFEIGAGWRLLHQPLVYKPEPGQLTSANAPYVVACIDRAADGCLAGEFDAMVTGPVHKAAITRAGIPFSGHTEHLAERCGAPLPVMLLTDGELNVALVTTHLPLRDVPDAITAERVARILDILHRDLTRQFGIAAPRITVCGLNPHAGEEGTLGSEDRDVIAPVVAAAKERGLNVSGPVPADTAFTPDALQRVDAVLAMYHDQGLPVIKARGFGGIANVTLGLPIVRTSVDHGTALELAGTGRASPASLRTAIATAVTIARARKVS